MAVVPGRDRLGRVEEHDLGGHSCEDDRESYLVGEI